MGRTWRVYSSVPCQTQPLVEQPQQAQNTAKSILGVVSKEPVIRPCRGGGRDVARVDCYIAESEHAHDICHFNFWKMKSRWSISGLPLNRNSYVSWPLARHMRLKVQTGPALRSEVFSGEISSDMKMAADIMRFLFSTPNGERHEHCPACGRTGGLGKQVSGSVSKVCFIQPCLPDHPDAMCGRRREEWPK